MDKNTLSNYGWVVICILVISVMLALATPFGRFIADGFKATYEGLGDVSNKAFEVIGFGGTGGGSTDEGEQGGETPDTPIDPDTPEGSCTHENTHGEYNPWYVGNHELYCDDCGEQVGEEPHYDNNVDGMCDGCNGTIAIEVDIATELQKFNTTLTPWSNNVNVAPFGAVGVPTLNTATVYNVTTGLFENVSAGDYEHTGTEYWMDYDGNIHEGTPSKSDITLRCDYRFWLFDAAEFEATAKQHFNIDDSVIAEMRNLIGYDGNTVYDGTNYKFIYLIDDGYEFTIESYVDNGNNNYDVYIYCYDMVEGIDIWVKMNIDWNGTNIVINNFTQLASEPTDGTSIYG